MLGCGDVEKKSIKIDHWGNMFNPNLNCDNCHLPKSEHSIHDTRCLTVMNWKSEEFEPEMVVEELATD
jgi:hypothetical protein